MLISADKLKLKLIGKNIFQIKLQKYYYKNELVASANVLYFNLQNSWSSIFIDEDELFYKEDLVDKELETISEDDFIWEIVDFPIPGALTISDLSWNKIEASLKIFIQGKFIITYYNDAKREENIFLFEVLK